MARAIDRSLILKGTLEAQTPLCVGGAEAGIEVDLSLAHNGRDEAYVPGTSLAGALRAWMEKNLSDSLPRDWWGFQDPNDVEHGGASCILVEDAPVKLPGGANSEIWHGIGIDRRCGTTARGVKFEREVLPKGTRFPLELRLDVADEEPPASARALLAHLAQALADGQIALGAGGTRGLGRVRLLEDWRGLERDWSCRDGILALLREPRSGRDATNTWKEEATKMPAVSPASVVSITVHWRPKGPVMAKAPQDGLAVDALPMLSADGGYETLVLPGSGIKGVLRSQAERIVRTVLNLDAVWSGDPKQRHLDQLAVPLVDEVFGSPRPGSRESGKEGRRGSFAVATCYARNTRLGREQWQNIAAASEGDASPLPQLFEQTGLAFQHAFHVAVDRWTGGAAESLLHSGIEPFSVDWEPLSLRLDMSATNARGAALALLWLVLRDLWEGRLGLGFGVNRGYGMVEIGRVEMENLDRIQPNWPARVQFEIREGKADIDGLSDWLRCLELAWESWISGEGGRKP